MGMAVYQLVNGKQQEMPLRAHLVFDKNNGKILHRHWQLESDKSTIPKETLFARVRDDLKTAAMDVLTVAGSEMHSDKKYSVDTKDMTLHED